MLRLPNLDVQAATDLGGTLQLLTAGRHVRAASGATDLVPNLKLGQTRAELLVLIATLPELQGISVHADHLRLGAAVTLAELAADPEVAEHLPALAFAAGRIASPQIRNAATLGGNLCLDTRCRYINQSELWREALGGCLKSHGTECHVVPGGQGCVAALSADTVPVLMAYGAEAEIAGLQDGQVVRRRKPIAELYSNDGLRHVQLSDGELLEAVLVPRLPPRTRVVYRKWAVRNSIDFPLVSVAVRLQLSEAGLVQDGRVAVGVLGPRPRLFPLDRHAGKPVDEALACAIAEQVYERCRPLPNVPYDADYRRERLRVEVRRAVRSWFSAPMLTP